MKNNCISIHGITIKTNIIGLFATIFLSFIFAIFLSNKSMPLAEGWYDYYAAKILEGQTVYTDFEYLFTPIYIYFIALFVKIFGYNILGMRLLGVFMFILIATILYFIIIQIFTPSAAFFGAVTAVFYLQSEVYTVFYDYVRLMDIAAYLAILFMVITIKKWIWGKKATIQLTLWGLFTSAFILIKQNMGLLFWAFSFLFLLACLLYLQIPFKVIVKNVFLYFVALLIPIIVTVSVIAVKSDLTIFINSVFLGAAEAKGGLINALFRWIVIGKNSFLLYLMGAVVAVLILVINYRISNIYQSKQASNKIVFCITVIGFLFYLLGVISILSTPNMGEYFATLKAIDAYLIFLICFFLMLIFIVLFLKELIQKKTQYAKYLPLLGILGAFFSISYGAGTSGGLSVGESALGVAALVALFFDSLKNNWGILLKITVIILCIYISLRNIGYKLVYPCQWWGINSGSIYNCTMQTDIPVLSGIYVTQTEKNMYEGIVDTIEQYSEEDDSIYCFPFIPILYCLSNRNDPGVFAKVQWFDVSTNESVINDIEIIKETKPKVIVIYNLNETTYDGHESAFNSSKVSGTRMMRDFLYEFVYTNNYMYINNFVSDNNNISVFVYSDEDLRGRFEGSGTSNDPYLINNTADLVNWAMLQNRDNKEYNRMEYYKLNTDIDLNEVIWIPAGYYQQNLNVNLDLGNYNVLNINSNNDRYNLGQTLIAE